VAAVEFGMPIANFGGSGIQANLLAVAKLQGSMLKKSSVVPRLYSKKIIICLHFYYTQNHSSILSITIS